MYSEVYTGPVINLKSPVAELLGKEIAQKTVGFVAMDSFDSDSKRRSTPNAKVSFDLLVTEISVFPFRTPSEHKVED